MGDAEAFGYQFRGQAILAAAIADAKANKGLSSGARVLVGGCSAGARGVMANVRRASTRCSSPLLSSLAVLASLFAHFFPPARIANTPPTFFDRPCVCVQRPRSPQLDVVASSLSADGIEVKGFIDSGLWVDALPADPDTTESLLSETQQVYEFVNAGALVPAACAAAYAGEEYKCLFGQFRFPFIETPYFANEAQFDSFQASGEE